MRGKTDKAKLIEELQHKLEVYDQNRLALLDDLERIDYDQLRRKPGPDNWSLLQILQHMVLAERDVLQYLPEQKELIARKRGLRARILYVVVLLILRWNIRVPVPSEGMVPDGNTSLSELRHQWDENLRWLRDYLEIVRPEDLKRAVFRRPVAGPLTGPQAATLAQFHFDAHLRQIRKTQVKLASK